MPKPSSPLQPKERRIKNFKEVVLGFSKRTIAEESRRCPQCSAPPCVQGCPLGIDIPAFIRFLRDGDAVGALKKIKEQNVFPSVCGRVCTAPCERACVFEKEESPIVIRALERYASDHGRPRSSGRKPIVRQGKKVAVIGSGPAGLTAAAYLASRDYQVTVFEALPFAGGALRYGIPGFRLPKDILDAEIEDVQSLGVAIKTGHCVGQNVAMDDFFTQGFSAVLLAAGAGGPRFEDVPGADLAGVYYAEEFLWQLNTLGATTFKRQARISLGKRVVVLGYGTGALDCARVCARLGREVTMVFASTEEGLDVYPEEFGHARDEGVQCEPLAEPLEIIAENHAAAGVRCRRLDFADPGSSGKWQLVSVPESEFDISADTVIMAVEHRPNVRFLRKVPNLKINENGTLWVGGETTMTSVRGIFAAGDVVSGGGRIVDAMASGKKAVEEIHLFLQIKEKPSP